MANFSSLRSRRDVIAEIVASLASSPCLSTETDASDELSSAGLMRTSSQPCPMPLGAWTSGRGGREIYTVGRIGCVGVQVPERPHQVLQYPTTSHRALVTSRRPGEWIWQVDLLRGQIVSGAAQDDSRRFEGHAVLSTFPTGCASLLTSETDTVTGDGLVVCRHAESFTMISEWRSGGIGPHELIAWENRGLLVANGGLLTLPETGRLTRSGSAFESSLALLDPSHGQLRQLWSLPIPHLSIRHLAISSDNIVGIALQVWPEEYRENSLPVFAVLQPHSKSLQLGADGEGSARRFGGYASSVAAFGNLFAVTCPYANLVAVWNGDGSFVGELRIPGASGIATHASGWWVTSTDGCLYSLSASSLTAECVFRLSLGSWDNHLSS